MSVYSYLLKVWYLGESYFGSQIQPNLPTIEGEFIKTLKRLKYIEEYYKGCLYSAQRTDAGVSAREALIVINTQKPLYVNELNTQLPPSIGIRAYCEVEKGFNPRHHILLKEYRYFYCFPDYMKIDIDLIKKMVHYFEGNHDFLLYYKKDKTRPFIDTQVNILKADCESKKEQNLLIFRFVGKRFLWEQVRRMSFALVALGTGKIDPSSFIKSLSPDENMKKNPLKFGPMPPFGLVLWKTVMVPEIEEKWKSDPRLEKKFRTALYAPYLKKKTECFLLESLLNSRNES